MPRAHAPPRPLPGAGRSPYQPHECQLAIPPQRERGSGLIPNCAGHQAVDYSRGAPRRRSLKPGRRPRQPATRRQGARRGAHRRPPHTSPTTTDSTVTLGSRTRPVRELITPIPCDRLAPPASAQPVGRTRPLSTGSSPRHSDIPNLVVKPSCWERGKTTECAVVAYTSRITLRRRPCFVGVSLSSVECVSTLATNNYF